MFLYRLNINFNIKIKYYQINTRIIPLVHNVNYLQINSYFLDVTKYYIFENVKRTTAYT